MYFAHEHYRSMQRRDARAAELRKQGYRVKKRSSRGSVLSPDYIVDAFEDGRTRDSYSPNGFGGLSDTYWGVLYTVEYDG